MANIITVSRQVFFQNPPSKLETIGVDTIFDVLPFRDSNYPFINTVIVTNYPTMTKIYVNESVSQVITLINGSTPPSGNVLRDNNGNALGDNNGNMISSQT